jgi:hypothetical protein
MTQVTVATLLTLAVMVPGTAILRLLGLTRPSNPWVVVPSAAVCGIAWAAVPSAASVLIGTGFRGFAAMFCGWSALPVVLALVLLSRSRRRGSEVRQDATRSMHRPPRLALLACGSLSLVAAALASVRGTSFRSDSAVHASIVEKLVNLPGARFDELGIVANGRPVDSAILPVWHHLLALAASPFEHPGIVALWSGGAAVALVVPWAGASLGWAATRTHAGAVLAAALTTGLVLAPWEGIPPTVAYLAYPGSVAIHLAIPLLLASLIESVAEDPAARRSARWGIGVSTAVIALLHLTYLYHVALAAAGMALVMLVMRPGSARRLVWPAAIVGAVSAGALGASMPFLQGSEDFNRGARTGWHSAVEAQWGRVLEGASSAIEPGYFLEAGGLAIVGLLLAPLVIPATRARNVAGTMLVIGPLLALGIVARSDVLADAVAGLGSFPPIPRSYKVIPWVITIVVLCDALDRRWSPAAPRLFKVATGSVLTAAAVAIATAIPGHLKGRDTPKGGIDPPLPGWTFDVVLAVLAAQLLVLASLMFLRRRRHRSAPATTDERAHGAGTSLVSASMACGLVVIVGAVAVAGAMHGIEGRPARLMQAEGLFGTNVANEATLLAVEDAPPGSRVLTNDGAALRMAAAAPVYVAHTTKRSFSTRERGEDYRRVVYDDRSDQARLDYLDKYDIDVVLTPLPAEIRNDLARLLTPKSGWRTIETRGDFAGWRRVSASDARD